MLFNSVEYVLLLACCVALYYAAPTVRLRQIVLLAGSVVFYVSWIPVYLLLLLIVLGVNFALAMGAARGRSVLFAAAAFNLGVLGYFKYAQFAADNLYAVIGGFVSAGETPAFNIILPLGISFYIFQVLAYVIDVRRGEIPPERDVVRFFLFIMFFPQLVAGPICRGAQLLPQLKEKKPFVWSTFVFGFLMFSVGLALKVVFADNISTFVDSVYVEPEAATTGDALAASIGFGVVILCDFWGYSTMALGSAMLFGIAMPYNFNLPYLATSLQSFWRRWHITLSFWLRDYLFKPLGGSRGSALATARNIMIVMVLGGLWHGAAWTFVIWGAIHGAWQVTERACRYYAGPWLDRVPAIVVRPFGWAMTMFVVFVGWVFFRAQTAGDAVTMLYLAAHAPIASYSAAQSASYSDEALKALALCGAFALAMVPLHLLSHRSHAMKLGWAGQAVAGCWLVVASVVLGSGDVQEFIYFQF